MSSLSSSKARSNGAAFEQLIDAGCRYYIKNGIAIIHKTPEPMRPIQPMGNGRFLAAYDKKAQPDYQGTLRGGRSIVFEAKHSDGKEMAQGRITTAQWADLDGHQAMGALCYVLVSFGFQIFSMIPWDVWKDMKNQVGRIHLKPTDELVKSYQVKAASGGILFLDYCWLQMGYIGGGKNHEPERNNRTAEKV